MCTLVKLPRKSGMTGRLPHTPSVSDRARSRSFYSYTVVAILYLADCHVNPGSARVNVDRVLSRQRGCAGRRHGVSRVLRRRRGDHEDREVEIMNLETCSLVAL